MRKRGLCCRPMFLSGLNDACTVWPRTTKFGKITRVGNRKGVFLGVIHAPWQGAGPSAPKFWDSFYFYAHHLTQNYQIWRGNRCGGGACLGVSHASYSKRAEFQRFPIFGVLPYLCLQPLTPNDQIWHVTHVRTDHVF